MSVDDVDLDSETNIQYEKEYVLHYQKEATSFGGGL